MEGGLVRECTVVGSRDTLGYSSMKPDSAKKRFLDYVEQSGVKLSSLSPTQGINLMLDFYSDERAEGCQIEEDGDMLLFQWGVYDWGEREHFEVNITRQFIEIGREDDEDEDSMSPAWPNLPIRPRQRPRGVAPWEQVVSEPRGSNGLP